MKNYELVCILDPQVGDGKFDEVVEKYEKYLERNGAEIAYIDRWGLRQLAYTSPSLKKRRQGYYVLYQFSADPALIRPLEDDLRLDEGVLRHLVVSVQGDFIRVPQLAPESVIEERHVRPGRERGGADSRSGTSGPGRAAGEKRESQNRDSVPASAGGEEGVPAENSAAEKSVESEEERAESESGN